MGSWQICHGVCLGLITFLGFIGITIVGMPLLFLTKIAIPLWILALALLIACYILYFKKKCVSKKMIILNSGILIAGIPFQSLQRWSKVFWLVGGIIVLGAILWYIGEKRQRRRDNHEKR